MTEKFEQLKKNLERRGYTVRILQNMDLVREHLLENIALTDTVGIGGSISVKQLGVDRALCARGNQVFWHWLAKPEEAEQTRQSASKANVYLTSTNAITEGGQMVNIDGFGNRLAAMAYGPEKVFVIVGQNKVCTDLNTAMERVKTVACPQNARRLGLNTPCAKTGVCVDCSSPQRFCNATLILERCPGSHPMEILLVEEDLGY